MLAEIRFHIIITVIQSARFIGSQRLWAKITETVSDIVEEGVLSVVFGFILLFILILSFIRNNNVHSYLNFIRV